MSQSEQSGPHYSYNPLRIVSRDEWGAGTMEDTVELRTPVSNVLHSYTDTEPCLTFDECKKAVKTIQESHLRDRDVTDIKYNFIIGGDLNVYEGRGWEFLPHLHPEYPDLWEECIEIAHIGREGMPDEGILEVTQDLLNEGVQRNYLKRGYEYHLHFFPEGGSQEDYLSSSVKDEKKESVNEQKDVYKVINCKGNYAKEFTRPEDDDEGEEEEEWAKNLKYSTEEWPDDK